MLQRQSRTGRYSNRYGRTVIRHLDAYGLLRERTVLAHCVHVDDGEIDLMAKSGTTVVHNPMSNLKLASGIAPTAQMQKAGVHLTLGTDGAISGRGLTCGLPCGCNSLAKGVQ